MPSTNAVLIYRTVSIEKMDAVLTACRTRWPQAPLAVLSSPNRQVELLADPRVAEVVPVALGTEGFPADLGLTRTFAAVVVPLGNRRGSGYANVFAAARHCRAEGHFLAPYCSELQPISVAGLWLRSTSETLLLALALPFAWLAAALLLRRDPR